jgi:hypothetical protein
MRNVLITEQQLLFLMEEKIPDDVFLSMPTSYKNIINKKIGEGTFGTAFLMNNGKVLKITRDLKEVQQASLMKGKHYEHLCNIYDIFQLNSMTQKYYGIVMDYVDVSNEEMNNEFEYLVSSLRDIYFGKTMADGFSVFMGMDDEQRNYIYKFLQRTNLDNYLDDDFGGREIYPTNLYLDLFVQICEAIDELKTIEKTTLDFHDENVGFDKNGVLKLFDQRNKIDYNN